ncbi:MAG TPA: hypothetical protein VE990_10990 [Acidimicrobiales bacterium]|nr:hypothetical protein [Acidimicrobiales bacterium]
MAADGTWNITINSPMGSQAVTLTLATDGNKLTGKASGPQGDLELTDGTVDGDNLTWKASLTQPMPITMEFTATVDGDKISGEAKLGSFGSASFSGTRA